MNRYEIIPGVGIIGSKNNYYIRTIDSNFKLPNNPQLIKEIRKILSDIAQGKKLTAPIYIIQYLLKIRAIRASTANQKKKLKSNIFFSSCTKLGKQLNKKHHLSQKECIHKTYIYYLNDTGRVLLSKQKMNLSPSISDIELSKQMLAYCEEFILKNLNNLEKISANQALIINVLDYSHKSEVINIMDKQCI
ncbi:hypothetical protein CBF56_02600 [Lactobacillus taiwanensis]|uniref:hypothetical protein n=1 Tax=Lactobacillus taiwanensis TaxID=508451 RepID=UPI000B9809CC|nr:hypothetical protein [Lactobacillus taiwanensis]MCR1916521.1 hypothetical protein [Lactobacillus taiwanensis]OYS20093.1 hypothetical protein CBF56_02600 [Lactobacillus taiwanensis]OYS20488.1 hypothetical protein CBF49_03400 [Lactobacillus taiwanensis]